MDVCVTTGLRPVIAQAIAELDAEHYESPVGGCSVCLPSLGWPCVSRQVADDLRAALGEGKEVRRCASCGATNARKYVPAGGDLVICGKCEKGIPG